MTWDCCPNLFSSAFLRTNQIFQNYSFINSNRKEDKGRLKAALNEQTTLFTHQLRSKRILTIQQPPRRRTNSPGQKFWHSSVGRKNSPSAIFTSDRQIVFTFKKIFLTLQRGSWSWKKYCSWHSLNNFFCHIYKVVTNVIQECFYIINSLEFLKIREKSI